MKLMKISLVAALLIGSSAFAIENTKVGIDAKLFYGTNDSGAGLFDKDQAYAQAALGLGVTSDLNEDIKGTAHLTVLSTLGLENQLVGNVWEGTNGTDDSYWFDEVNIETTLGNTTISAGRMKLDTPLVFTETWSIAYNTFESAIVANTDIPNTTIVAGYVGGSNGGDGTGSVIAPFNLNGTTNFSQFYNGAYVVGATNNSWKPLAVEAWYYGVTNVLQGYWAQADLEMSGVMFGAQYTGGNKKAGDVDVSAYAVKLGYDMHHVFDAYIAYSQTGSDAAWGANLSGSGQSKLYTEAWWTYGAVTAQDTAAITAEVSVPVEGIAHFAVYYTMATQNSAVTGDELTFTELTLEVAKSFGKLDTALVYMNETNEIDRGKHSEAVGTVQAYLTYNF